MQPRSESYPFYIKDPAPFSHLLLHPGHRMQLAFTGHLAQHEVPGAKKKKNNQVEVTGCSQLIAAS